MEIFHDPPNSSSFISLSQHQSQTPDSFYSGPPVLYHHSANAQLLILRSELVCSTALRRLALSVVIDRIRPNGNADQDDNEVVLPAIDLWVTSENFLLYSSLTNIGISIPYPNISLHAIQRLHIPSDPANEETHGLFVQITTSDGFDDHNPDDTITLTLIPSAFTGNLVEDMEPFEAPSLSVAEISTSSYPTPIEALFSAVSVCANLHPDPQSPSSDTDDVPYPDYESTTIANGIEGLPPPVPGSGGWITAENMNDFFDEEGNWRGGGLGPGAGIVREREEENTEDDRNAGATNVDGVGDASKWRRTG